MADINARLLQAIDGSAPQHKVRGQNRFEFSEGSDRTLHVKIAGKNGNPLDFEGDKFPVEDKQLQSVINELNKVKSELESIKNGTLKVKNDQLIDKIDALLAKQQSLEDKINSVIQGNAFRTQLTGSNVELRLLDADLGGSPITVGQGLTYTIDNIDVKDYAKCYLGVLVENQTKWSMSLIFLNRAIYTSHTVQNITTTNQKTDFVDVLSNSARITITNNRTTDMNIKRIYLFLSKMR